MLVCPVCGAENLDGDDVCMECTQTLTDLSIRVPMTSLEANLLRDRVELLPLQKPVTVSPQTTVGIFSERDALMKLNTDAPKFFDRPISQFMTPDPVTLETNDKIAFALHKMDLGGYRHLPVLDGDKPVGVISIRDILGYLTKRIATG